MVRRCLGSAPGSRCPIAHVCGCGTPCDALPVSSADVARLDAEHNAAPERRANPRAYGYGVYLEYTGPDNVHRDHFGIERRA